MTDFQIGDIVHVSTDNELLEPNHELPAEEGWDAIVVDIDKYGDPEVAWLSRSNTTLRSHGPINEVWDSSTVRVQPGYDAHVKLLKRATYQEVQVGG